MSKKISSVCRACIAALVLLFSLPALAVAPTAVDDKSDGTAHSSTSEGTWIVVGVTDGAANCGASGGVCDNDFGGDGDPLKVYKANGALLNGGSTGWVPIASGARVYTHFKGLYIYDPNGAFESLADGETVIDSWTYSLVADGEVSTSAKVFVAVTGVNDAPAITSGATGSTAENVATTTAVYTATATDQDSTDTLTFSFGGGVDDALFSIDGTTGDVTFNSSPDFENPTDSGGNNAYEITVQVSDGNGGTDSQAVTIGVTDANEVPVANDDDVGNFDEDTTQGTNVVSNDTDVDGDALIVTKINGQAITQGGASVPVTNGEVALNVDGKVLQFTPDTNFNGAISFTYTVRDSALTDTAQVTGTVTAVNDSPVFIGPLSNRVVDEDSGNIQVPLDSVFTDVDDNNLTFKLTLIGQPDLAIGGGLIDESNLSGAIVTNNSPVPGQRTIEFTTNASNATLQLMQDAHGKVDVTVTATDSGQPPFAPAAPIPLSDEGSFNIVVNALADDTPVAIDDHYSEFSELVLQEDSGGIIFDPTTNDDAGDAPIKVIRAGQEFVDSFGAVHRFRSGTRTADPNDTGDFQLVANGEVSCSDPGCQDLQTNDTSIDGSGLTDFQVIYKPTPDFNGEDSFTYCIQDETPQGESAFSPPNDVRCAEITVKVEPVNDPPEPKDSITYVVDQADTLIVPVDEGLITKVRDRDNTHIDGKGCNPLDVACNPGPGDPQPDTLHFRFQSALTQHGQLLPPFASDGSFTYQPDPTFAGNDQFVFDVCDTNDFSNTDRCVFDVVANIIVEPIAGAPVGSTGDVVESGFQLSQVPLELAVGPEPNVLIVNDDSGSMEWDILTDQASGIYHYPNSYRSVNYVMKASEGQFSEVAPSEEATPDQGLWRLRNSTFSTTYYNPDIRYTPWDGLDTNDNEFPDSPPTAARHNPLTSSPTTNLRQVQSYDTQGFSTGGAQVCEEVCVLYFFGFCWIKQVVCSGGSGFGNVTVQDYYIPRYYTWNDLDNDGELDATPSPATDPDNAEGTLVEIRPASEGGADTYPKNADRTDCVTLPDACTFEEELQNFANWFTYWRTREFTAKSALGKVVAEAENMRIGYAKLNSQSNVEPIKSMNSSARTGVKADLLDSIYQTDSNGGTPLRRALRSAGRHFECKDNDIFNSNGDSSPGDAACPIQAAPDGNCQQNFTLLMSDGAWNGWSPFIGDADDDNNSNFDGGKFADSSNDTLADVAMHYYERDLHPSLSNEVPTSGRDRDGAPQDAFENGGNNLMHQHMKAFTVGFGVIGSIQKENVPANFTESFDWGNPSSTAGKVDDMLHAGVNGRGDFLSANNAKVLADSLTAAFAEFAQGSGAAAAVSFNSQEVQQDTLVFRAFYNTTINTGDLIAVPLTEQGVGDVPEWRAADRLDLVTADEREIITLDRETGTGIPFRPGALNQEQRSVFIDDPGASDAEKDIQVTRRVNYLRGDPGFERPAGDFRERPVNRGRLGDIVSSKPIFVGPPSAFGRNTELFPQGNPISTFVSGHQNRDKVIYTSANDGMLHAFSAETGDELFAYMPNNLMVNPFSRQITELLNFQYTHKFFVDLTPAINDVFIDSDGDGDREWTTMLVGGHGAGAKAYFGLNITNPDQFSESTANEVVMWEFTEEDDTYPTDSNGNPLLTGTGDQRQDLQNPAQPVKDMGYSFSVPTIAMSNLTTSDGEQVWVSVSGNGYNSTSGIAKLFVLFLEKGVDGTWCHPDMIHNETLNGTLPAECVGEQDFVKLDTGFGVKNGLPNGLGTPRAIDVDGNGTVDFVYVGDYYGNFFRFDLTSDDFDEWSVTKIFKAEYEDGNSVIHDQPITTQPIVTLHPTQPDGFIVIFATGSYITVPDGTDTTIQSIYGIWDRLGPELIKKNELVQQRYTNLSDPEFGNVRKLSSNVVDFSIVGQKKGWFNDLESVPAGGNQGIDEPEFAGERAIRNIQLRGGLAFVNSVIPRSANSCVNVAGGFALSFCPATGGTNCLGSRSIFDLDNDGVVDAGDNVGGQVVAGIRFEDAVPTDSSFIGDKRVTQLGDSKLDITGTNTDVGDNTGRLSWKRLNSVE